MSEYWVSNKKYFCKYCNIYIADDKPSRTQHESGLRHKGNVERFVRGLYKAGEKRKQDLEEEKREMARVEKAAQAAYAQDVGAGLVKPGSSSAVPSSSKEPGPSKPATKPSDPYTNYSTAASLGYVDPDAERRKIEAERRMKEGIVGEWEVVEVPSTGTEGLGGGQEEGQVDGRDVAQTDAHTDTERKRQVEVQADDDDIRPWKLRKKTLDIGFGEIYDPGVIPIKLKTKKEEAPDTLNTSPNIAASTSSNNGISALPKWTAKGWNRPGEAQGPSSPPKTSSTEKEGSLSPAPEVSPSIAKAEPVDVLSQPSKTDAQDSLQPKAEEAEPNPAPAAGSLFRKRKGPAGARGRR